MPNDTSRQEQLIDVSHVVEDGLITYKGLLAPIICDYLSREASRKVYTEGTEFHIGKIEVDSGRALVGIDSLNIDDTADVRRPVHSTLLRAEIPIVEHLCGLGSLPDAGFRFFAVPVKAFGTIPVRAFGIV